MSLINQVLQDLDRRGAARPDQAGLGGPVRAVAARGEPRWPRLAAFAATACAAAVLGWILLEQQPAAVAKPESVPVGSPPAGAPAAPEPSAPASALPVAEDAPPAAQVAEGSPPASRLSLELARPPAPREPAERPQAAAPDIVAAVRTPAASLPHPVTPERPKEAAVPAARAPSAPPAAAAPPGGDGSSIEKRVRQPEPQERSEVEFRKAVNLLQQGRVAEAIEALGALLQADPAQDPARQTLAGLYVEQKRPADAERVLREGVRVSPRNGGFALALARLQLDRGDAVAALATVQEAIARGNGQAELHGFAAALLAREGRHREAAAQYRAALAVVPGSGPWLIGLGIALEADGHPADAQEAFARARGARNLTPELQSFVDQRLRALQAR